MHNLVFFLEIIGDIFINLVSVGRSLSDRYQYVKTKAETLSVCSVLTTASYRLLFHWLQWAIVVHHFNFILSSIVFCCNTQ